MSFFEKANNIFKNVKFIRHLGAVLTSANENSAVAELKIDEKHANYMGGLHGGVVAGVVDTVAFFPGKLLPSGLKLTTSGFDIKFFRPANIGDTLIFEAEVLHLGKKRANVEVKAFLKENNKLVSLANVDLMII